VTGHRERRNSREKGGGGVSAKKRAYVAKPGKAQKG